MRWLHFDVSQRSLMRCHEWSAVTCVKQLKPNAVLAMLPNPDANRFRREGGDFIAPSTPESRMFVSVDLELWQWQVVIKSAVCPMQKLCPTQVVANAVRRWGEPAFPGAGAAVVG